MAPLSWNSWSHLLALLVVLLLASVNRVAATGLNYCSTINTGSTPTNSSIFQSNGLCSQFCLTTYAFAVLQGHDCWCSDFAPGTTIDLTDCDTQCPGYPDDMCASTGFYGYLTLVKVPSGTQGGSSAAATSSTPTPTPPPPTTSKASTSQSSGSSSSSLTWTPTPTLSLETITGQVKTVTVTPTAPPVDLQKTGKGSSSHLSSGAAAGIAVAAVVALLVGAAIIFFCLRKQKNKNQLPSALLGDDSGRPNTGGPSSGPSRTMSENSRYILATDGEKVVEHFVDDGPGAKRKSRLLPVDPRLNPYGPLYMQGSKSRDSINTINDAHDYSRKIGPGGSGPILRAMNPDD